GTKNAPFLVCPPKGRVIKSSFQFLACVAPNREAQQCLPLVVGNDKAPGRRILRLSFVSVLSLVENGRMNALEPKGNADLCHTDPSQMWNLGLCCDPSYSVS